MHYIPPNFHFFRFRGTSDCIYSRTFKTPLSDSFHVNSWKFVEIHLNSFFLILVMHMRIAMIDIILATKVKKNMCIGGELIIVLWCGKYSTKNA